jgi:1-acyl-sn-glycerol-3-phosphate acyltransferase
MWRMRVEGSPKRPPGAFVAVANHESILDILFISRVPWEMKWIAKESLFHVPWIGWMMRLSRDIPLVRTDAESRQQALVTARGFLDRGVPVMVFPEGTRSRTGELLPFRAGAFRLAIEAGVPILPIAVRGTSGGMPVNSPWIRPTVARARVLPLVETRGLSPEEAPRLAEEVRTRILHTLQELAPATA